MKGESYSVECHRTKIQESKLPTIDTIHNGTHTCNKQIFHDKHLYTHMYMHPPQDGCMALYFATCYRREDVVELLLEAKADPNVQYKVRLTGIDKRY